MKSKLLILGVLSILIGSCASREDIVYFQDASEYETIVGEANFETKFKNGDIVSIHVSTLDPEASAPFNLYSGLGDDGLKGEQVNYIIDKEGNIDFPVVGKIKLSGLSRIEAHDLLALKLEDYLKNPIINIAIKNFKVTILGAVNSPGTYPVEGERISILEALGLAGDTSVKGRRDNVLVIRDFNGTKVYNRIDLREKNALSSPVFYLTQNDVVYVEPNKSGLSQSSLDQRSTILVSIASVLITSTVIILTR